MHPLPLLLLTLTTLTAAQQDCTWNPVPAPLDQYTFLGRSQPASGTSASPNTTTLFANTTVTVAPTNSFNLTQPDTLQLLFSTVAQHIGPPDGTISTTELSAQVLASVANTASPEEAVYVEWTPVLMCSDGQFAGAGCGEISVGRDGTVCFPIVLDGATGPFGFLNAVAEL